jgi:hypothetical protein
MSGGCHECKVASYISVTYKTWVHHNGAGVGQPVLPASDAAATIQAGLQWEFQRIGVNGDER